MSGMFPIIMNSVFLEVLIMFKKIAMIVLAIFVLAMAASCRHTAHGFGQDVEQMGKKIKEKTD